MALVDNGVPVFPRVFAEKLLVANNLRTATQSHLDCSRLSLRCLILSQGKFTITSYGLGSDLHLWSQVMCNALEDGSWLVPYTNPHSVDLLDGRNSLQ